MSNKTDRMFELCKKTALKNFDNKNNHHFGALLVKGGSIISSGANIPRTNGLIRFIAEHYGDRPLNIHAEMNVLLGVPTTKSRGAVVYVARVKEKNGICQFKLAKPCKHCQDFMRKRKIKRVYYSISGDNKVQEWGVIKL